MHRKGVVIYNFDNCIKILILEKRGCGVYGSRCSNAEQMKHSLDDWYRVMLQQNIESYGNEKRD